MKTLKPFVYASLASVLLFAASCTKENVSPGNGDNGLQPAADFGGCSVCPFPYSIQLEGGGHGDGCACTSITYDLKDAGGSPVNGSGTDYGFVEVLGDNSNLIIQVNSNNSGPVIYIGSYAVYYGPSASVPLSAGNFDTGNFPYVITTSPLSTTSTMIIEGVNVNDCNTLVVVVNLVTLGQFGNPIPAGVVYLAGSAFANGFAANHCHNSCAEVAITGCNTVVNGIPGGDCTILTAVGTGGAGSYSYSWSNGASTPSITVCPTASTTYSVTMTDAAGACATAAIPVTYLDISCGNGKVTICRILPNGNTLEQCLPANTAAVFVGNGSATWGPCGFDYPCD